ncbi:hypothetical protein OFM35_28365, partial [Escherichia coli]|nr:hypothetical protein [Escherichia coli]
SRHGNEKGDNKYKERLEEAILRRVARVVPNNIMVANDQVTSSQSTQVVLDCEIRTFIPLGDVVNTKSI